MRNALFALAIICPILASAQNYQGVVRIGLLEYPPHIVFDDDIGPLPGYMSKIVEGSGYQAKFIRMLPERGLRELNKGNIDFLMPLKTMEAKVSVLSLPILHSVPGLCFKKDKFIPILSATHRFDDLIVGMPNGYYVVDALASSQAMLLEVKGDDAISRGIDLTQRGRIDAFYHPNPSHVYYEGNPTYKEVACSSFHGYFIAANIAVSPKIKQQVLHAVESQFVEQMQSENYELYLSRLRRNR